MAEVEGAEKTQSKVTERKSKKRTKGYYILTCVMQILFNTLISSKHRTRYSTWEWDRFGHMTVVH